MKHFEDFEREAKQYPKILERYEKNGKVFTDPNFHPNCNIAEPKVEFNEKDHIWERIDKYYTVPLFKKEAISENAIQQGELGTCYFIASLCRIARQPELVEQLFDTRTRTNKKGKKKNDEYTDSINLKCGAVVVYFHAFGKLTPVLIDTLVPFKRGTRRPRFVHPSDIKYSPWFCLVEKAFAKLHGSYSLIVGGALSSAIYHLFGYYPCYKKISEMLEKREEKLKKQQELTKSKKAIKFDKNEYLFSQLMQWQHENAVLGADITVERLQDGVTEDDVIDNGLVTNHAYLIMKVRREQNKNFICLRNPWGDHEWLGDWSDTSPLWTPELKKSLGVFSKDDGTFWMVDKDFFKYFSSFDVAKPVNPEYHIKSFMTRLDPGHYDGISLDNEKCDLFHHQTFVFKLKDARIKTDENDDDDEENEEEEDYDEISDRKNKKHKNMTTVDDIKVYIRIEKRSPRMDSSTDTIMEKPRYAMFIVYSGGKRLEFDQLKYYYRSSLSTSSQFFRSTHHIKYNKPFVIVFQRLNKCNYTEECYVQISCKYDFELYDHDYPDAPFEEDEKFGVVFNNKSKRYSNIVKKLRVKKIAGKDIQAFATINTTEFDESFYKHLKYNHDSDNSSAIFEYDISGTGESEVDKRKKKNGNNQPSQKEMKKILAKKKEVEEKEREIEEEKNRLDKEKKKLDEEKKKIQKENERLEAEKKKLEVEKRKSSKNIRDDDNLKSMNEEIIGDRGIVLTEPESDSDESTKSKGKPAQKNNKSAKNQQNRKKSQAKGQKSRNSELSESYSDESAKKTTKGKTQQVKGRRKAAESESADSESESDDTNKKPAKGKAQKAKGRLSQPNKRRTAVSDSSDAESYSDDDNNKKPAKGKAPQRKGKQAQLNKRRTAESDSSDAESYSDDDNNTKPAKGRAPQRKGKQAQPNKRRTAVSDSSDAESESDDNNKKPAKGRAPQRKGKQAQLNKRRTAGSDSSDAESYSDDTNKKPAKGKAQKAKGRLSQLNKRRTAESESSDAESDSDDDNNKKPAKGKAPQRKGKQTQLNKRRTAESDSSDAESYSDTKNKKPIRGKSSQPNKRKLSESESDETPKKPARNKSPRPNRRGARESDSSDSDNQSRVKPRGKAKNLPKRRTTRESSDSEASESSEPIRGRNFRKGRKDISSDSSDSNQNKRKAASTKNNTRNKLRQPEATNKNKTQKANPRRRVINSDSSDSGSVPSKKGNKRAKMGRKVSESSDESSDSNIRTKNKARNLRKRPKQAKRLDSESESSN